MQEEFNAFLETVSDKPETRMAFLLLYWTGMRIGELLALTYNDINLEEKTISINKSYQRLKGKDMITQPKTPKSIRVITMPDFLAEEFREYCSHLYGIMKKERLFRFTKSHMEHCMATGIEWSGVKRIRLHDLRHSHARNRRVFLPTGIKRWTESEKYGKISIRNDIVKSEFNDGEKIMGFLDSEMMKRFMHSAPVNIFFKDTECRYCFASEICDLVSVGENGSIVGKTDLEVQKFPEMGKMYYEDDKKILATGEDSQYISEFPMENGESLYFEIKKSAARDENGNIIGIVGIVDNVTERVCLEKKVEVLSIIDGLTGVYNRNYLKYRVEEKKKNLIFPFTVIMSDCNYLKVDGWILSKLENILQVSESHWG